MIHKAVVPCAAYLPPHSLLAAIINFYHLSNLHSGTIPVMAIGNYNLPHINWQPLSSDSSITNTF